MANFLNLFTAYRNMENQDRTDATDNYLNKTAGNPQGVDPQAVQVHRSNDITNNTNQLGLDTATQTQHLQNMRTFLDTLGSADAQAAQAVGPAPAPLPDNATVEQQNQWNQANHQYQSALQQAQQQARGQAWERAAQLAPALGIDPAHMAPMQQDFMQHGEQFARDIHGAIQARLTPNSGEVVGTPGGTQDANGNTVLVTRGGQTRTLTGIVPTSTVDTNTRVAATRDVAANNDAVQREAITERATAAAAAHPGTQTTGQAIAAPILEAAVPAALSNIDRIGSLVANSPLFKGDNFGMRAARVAEYALPTSQFRTNVESLQHQMSLIDLRAMRASGFSLGRVTNTEFLAASSALANLSPNLDASQLSGELARVRTHLVAFQRALTADMNNPANAHVAAPGAAPAAAAPADATPAPNGQSTLSPEAQALLNGFQ